MVDVLRPCRVHNVNHAKWIRDVSSDELDFGQYAHQGVKTRSRSNQTLHLIR